jgi:hypothetical protein
MRKPGGKEMKKLLSISLVLILAGGFLMAENTKAEAIDPATAALVAAGVFLVPPFISVLAHAPYYAPAPVYYGGGDYGYAREDYGYGGGYYGGGYYGGGYYGGGYYGGGYYGGGYYGGPYYGRGYYGRGYYGGSYPAQTRVIYKTPRYGGYYGGYQGRGYGYERGWRGHRDHREYRRGHGDYRGRYYDRYRPRDY